MSFLLRTTKLLIGGRRDSEECPAPSGCLQDVVRLEKNKQTHRIRRRPLASFKTRRDCHIEFTGDTLKMPISDDLMGWGTRERAARAESLRSSSFRGEREVKILSWRREGTWTNIGSDTERIED